MWENETSIDIAAPPDQVYGYLADFARHSEWSMSVATIEQATPGPVSVGTEFKASETIPQKFASVARITALQAPALISWESTDYRIFRTQWSFVISQQNGGTHLVQRVRFEPIGLLGNLLLLMRRPQVPPENRHSLERIKAKLESK
jgi:hypothetical protein